MADIKVPHFHWDSKSLRGKWIPAPNLRKAGWKYQALKNEAGTYLSFPEAIHAAQNINEKVKAWRMGRAKLTLEKKSTATKTLTCQDMWNAYQKSEFFTKNKPKTQRDYRIKMNVFLEEFGDKSVKAVKKSHIFGFWEEMRAQRGKSMANSTIATVRLCFSYAEKKEWVTVNPARKIGMIAVKPRTVIWKPEEIITLLNAVAEFKRPSIRFASIIALHTGQRQGDILKMSGYELRGNKIRLKQGKRGAFIDIPQTPQMIQCLEDIQEHHRELGITQSETLIVSETTCKPYKSDNFGKVFRDARKIAALSDPAILKLTYADFRDTTVTRLANAGSTIAEIIAITGHSMESAHAILKHYLVLNSDMAQSGMDKYVAWMEENGIEY